MNSEDKEVLTFHLLCDGESIEGQRKYSCEIIEVQMDDDYDVLEYFKIIRELPLRQLF